MKEKHLKKKQVCLALSEHLLQSLRKKDNIYFGVCVYSVISFSHPGVHILKGDYTKTLMVLSLHSEAFHRRKPEHTSNNFGINHSWVKGI